MSRFRLGRRKFIRHWRQETLVIHDNRGRAGRRLRPRRKPWRENIAADIVREFVELAVFLGDTKNNGRCFSYKNKTT